MRAGRFAGIHTIICTQRPSAGILEGDTKALVPVKLCFRTVNQLNSRMILGEGNNQAAFLQGPGRAILQTPSVTREVQVMFLEPIRCRLLVRHQIKPQGQQIAPPISIQDVNKPPTSW